MNAIPAASRSSAISDSASTIGAASTTSSSSTANDQDFAAALTSAGPKSARKPTTNKAQDGDHVGGQLPGTGNVSPPPAASVAAAAAASAATAAGNPANSALGGTAAIGIAVNNAASRGAANGGAPIGVASGGAAEPISAGSGFDPQAAVATEMELPQDIALAHPIQTGGPNEDSGMAANARAQAAAQAAPITAVTAAAGARVKQSAVTAQDMSATQIPGARVAALSDGAAAGTNRARPASGADGKLNSAAGATGNATTSGSASADGSAAAGANTEAWTDNGAWTSTATATAVAASAAAANAPSDAGAANAAGSSSISSDWTILSAADAAKAAGPSGAPVQALAVLGARPATATTGSEKARTESALAGVGTVDKHASKGLVDASNSGAAGNGVAGAAPATVNAASATATPTLKVDAGVETAEFGQGLADRVSWMVDNNLNGAKLQVNPAQLGPIEVRIAVQGGHAQVWLTSHSAVTRDALESSSPKLREMLGAQGFGQVSVDISQRSFQERSTHAQPYDWTPKALDSSVSAVQSSARSLPHTSLGALDAYA